MILATLADDVQARLPPAGMLNGHGRQVSDCCFMTSHSAIKQDVIVEELNMWDGQANMSCNRRCNWLTLAFSSQLSSVQQHF